MEVAFTETLSAFILKNYLLFFAGVIFFLYGSYIAKDSDVGASNRTFFFAISILVCLAIAFIENEHIRFVLSCIGVVTMLLSTIMSGLLKKSVLSSLLKQVQ